MKRSTTTILTMAISTALGMWIPTATQAGIIAYETPAAVSSNQSFVGTVGMDFDVLNASGISITSLGVYDDFLDGGAGVLGTTTRVAIFDRNTLGIVTGLDTMIGPGGAATGGNFLKAITPVTLPTGQYSVVYDANVAIVNTGVAPFPGASTLNTGGGAIGFVGGGRFDTSDGFNYPGSVDGGPVNRY